jgi:molecular chaperone GrpE
MRDDERDDREKGLDIVESDGTAPGDSEVEILAIDGAEPEGELGAAAPPAGPSDASSASDVARLEAELAAARDRHLRLMADFDNFRKRVGREREDLRRLAFFDVVRDLLPVADNLERALAAQGSLEDLRRGVEMTLRQLHEGLRRFGVVEVAALGERFDPKLHEAVSHREDPGVDAPRVVAELQRGYRLGDRLLRPALVVVAAPPEGEAASAPPAGADEDAASGSGPRHS